MQESTNLVLQKNMHNNNEIFTKLRIGEISL